ncbi:MAG TPA: cytochrome P450 [Herpetosiphonaceae bacterium]
MDTAPEEVGFVRELRSRCAAEGRIFWINDKQLAVFDPDIALHINAINFSDLTLPDKLADLVRGRTGKPISWKSVRTAWIEQLRRLSDSEGVGRIAARVSALIDEHLDRPVDLVWLAREICTRAFFPLVLADLPPADRARVLRDQTFKVDRLMIREADAGPKTVWKTLRSFYIQASAGSAVRREIWGRARGRRPRKLDLTDPIVDMLPDLGIDRAVDAVTTILTAIAGPPAASTACLLYELTRQTDWAERLSSELDPIPLHELYAAPMRMAPTTTRFVKESLRMWSPPLFMTRPVRTEINLEQACLNGTHHYLVSPYLTHHDPRHWTDPDTFDPDRWLQDAGHSSHTGARYVPFGWSPTACIGASVGTTLLMLLSHLMSTRYRIQLTEPESVRIVLDAVPLPVHFHGTITRR